MLYILYLAAPSGAGSGPSSLQHVAHVPSNEPEIADASEDSEELEGEKYIDLLYAILHF